MPPRNQYGGDSAASKASREDKATRTIYVVDLGTTYGTIGVLTMPAAGLSQTVTPTSIRYIDGYIHDRCLETKASDVVPTSLYFDNDGIRWGWDVPRCLEVDDHPIHRHPERCLTQFKLLLDETDATKDIRKDLSLKVLFLKKAGVIEHEDDLFIIYFTLWFTFARDRAHQTKLNPGATRPEFVICAPSAYSVTSYALLYKAFDTAIRLVWDQHDDKNPPRIFSISEPAAAASYCLARSDNSLEVSTMQFYTFTHADIYRLGTAC
jgi:hypothetical protein